MAPWRYQVLCHHDVSDVWSTSSAGGSVIFINIMNTIIFITNIVLIIIMVIMIMMMLKMLIMMVMRCMMTIGVRVTEARGCRMWDQY